MKISRIHPFVFSLLCFLTHVGVNAQSETQFLWPDKVPGEVPGEVAEEAGETRGGILRISNVSKPSLTIFPANPESANGTSILVCPGGGYNILAYEHEGSAICEWLNSLGVTGFLLKYRVPRRKNRLKHEAPCRMLNGRSDSFATMPRNGRLTLTAWGFLVSPPEATFP